MQAMIILSLLALISFRSGFSEGKAEPAPQKKIQGIAGEELANQDEDLVVLEDDSESDDAESEDVN